MIEFESIINIPTPIIELKSELFFQKKVKVYVKRDDLTHPWLSGNKFRKLKYNILEAKNKSINTIISFGGAYSNHIYALAGAGKLFGFKTIGIIRGQELTKNSSPTLQFASEMGMELRFVDRESYRNKDSIVLDIHKEAIFIPEGGSNSLALQGVSEMVDEIIDTIDPDYICAAVGTGGTIAGIASNGNFKGQVVGIPVLKNADFLNDDIKTLLSYQPENLKLFGDYHYGGYAKSNSLLEDFIVNFEENFGFEIEQVYTAKLFCGVFDLIEKDYFQCNSTIVLIHTGGLQGRKKSLPKKDKLL